MITDTLPASELRYRRLFETAHDGILMLDPATRRIIEVNPCLSRLLGYTRDEILGKELDEIVLLKDEAASQAVFRELQANGSIRQVDLQLVNKDGRRLEVEFCGDTYEEGEQQVVRCQVRDITARKMNENALRDADLKRSLRAAELEAMVHRRTNELRLSNQQLENFVSSVTRDLRAPLRSMQGFAQLLVQDHGAKMNQHGRDYANYINKAAQVMDRLLLDLHAFSQISQQRIELEPVALESVVESALSGCETEIRESDAEVDSNAPWPVVVAHATTLRQVLVNLIGNALKFVSSRPPQVKLSSEERPGGLVRIWVEDNGIGIPQEFHERIFQVFQRLHTTSYAGTGIGLAIVQKGVERMSGRVGVTSTPGEGSRFWIDLPKAPSLAVVNQP